MSPPAPGTVSGMSLAARAAVALGLARSDDAGLGDPTQWESDVTPPSRSERSGVTVREALGLDAVFRSLLILQTAVSQLTLDVWRRDDPLTVTPSLIAKPNIYDDQSGFLADTTVSLASRGNAFWLHHFGPSREVVNLEPLNPLHVHVYLDRDGRRRFSYDGKTYTPREMTHLRLLRVPGDPVGLGPIQATARALAGALSVAGYSSQWFTSAGVPSGTLTTEQTLTADQAAAWKKQWNDRVKTGETAILGNGLAYKPIYLTPREAQWIDSQRFSITAIARMFGIPPRLLIAAVEGDSMTYTNAETEDRQFIKYTLAAYLRPIEQALTTLLPRGQTARFNLEGFLRGDTLSRYQAHQIGLDAGFLTKDEVRRIEGLSPLPQTATKDANV